MIILYLNDEISDKVNEESRGITIAIDEIKSLNII